MKVLAKKLVCRLFCGSMICVATPSVSVAVEALSCEFQVFDRSGKGFPGVSRVQISDDFLLWFEPSALAGPQTNPPYDGLKYKILENSEIGIVAVTSFAYRESDIGPVLGAWVLTIRKSDGAMRVGVVAADGVVNRLTGNCK